jgi:hypothetical protein
VDARNYDLTVFKVKWGNLTLKIYDKGGRVLRIEVVAVAVILGFIGFSRPLRASLNPSVSIVVEAPSTIMPPTQNLSPVTD